MVLNSRSSSSIKTADSVSRPLASGVTKASLGQGPVRVRGLKHL